jgi:tRNA-(ms[2]io[6]A)-hydroxylase
MLKLASATDPMWGARAVAHLDEILLDHAHCEKKAAGSAVALVFRYPDHAILMEPLSALAREELAHFEAVLRHLARRGVPFGRQRPSPYAGRLRRILRSQEPGRLVDTLLCSAVIEARSCERLGLLAEALAEAGESELARFYAELRRAEARHHGLYVELACRIGERAAVAERLAEVTAHESVVLARAPTETPRLHN